MTDYNKDIMSIPLEDNKFGNTHIDVSIKYDKGGMNYWAYKVDSRGYYLIIHPVKKSNGCTSFMITGQGSDGVRILLKEATRFNAKTLNELANDPGIAEYVARFENKYGYVESIPAAVVA